MVKFRKGNVITIALTSDEVKVLQNDKVYMTLLSEFGIPDMELAILIGPNNETLLKEFRKAFGPDDNYIVDDLINHL